MRTKFTTPQNRRNLGFSRVETAPVAAPTELSPHTPPLVPKSNRPTIPQLLIRNDLRLIAGRLNNFTMPFWDFGTAHARGARTQFALLLPLLLALLAVMPIANAENVGSQLRQKVEAALPDSIGASVLAIDGGKVIFRGSFGRADVESNEPCTPASNFRMASTSKQFTAMAVLLLVDDGKLALDDTLDKFFPGAPKYWRQITIKQLLTHTSGLPDYEELIPEGTTLQLDDMDVVRMLIDTSKPLFQPGSKWRYSNSAFVVLGMIVEIAADQPFHNFMTDQIFAPLDMNNTLLFQRGLNEVPNRAFGHRRKDGQWIRADQSVTSATRGDGVVYTSLEDYEKWLRGLAANRLLTPESHRAMFLPQEKTTRDDSHYGYGWFIDQYRGQRRIHHNGDTSGFRICSQTYPDRQAAIVLQFNSNVEEEMTKVGERLSDLLIFDPKKQP
jgi:CubicO group peptidase (beta-lactamase class C family)